MLIEEIPLESIETGNETYRISESLDVPRLESSLREVGQLSPLIVVRGPDGELVPVCGFRRLRAMLKIGFTRVLASVLPAGSEPVDVFRTALWDNLAHRELNDLEKVRTLHVLKSTCGVGQEKLVEEYLPLLGLSAHKNVLRSYLSIASMLPDLRRMLEEGRITLATACRLASWREGDQIEFAAACAKARWSASLQRQLLESLEELALVRADSPSGILKRTEIVEALDEPGLSPFQRGEKVYLILSRWRYPRLSGAEQRFLEGKKSLGLPGCVRLSPEPYFETPRLRVEFEAPTPERFRELAEAVRRASESPRFIDLFEVR